jgi:hypothetical protein
MANKFPQIGMSPAVWGPIFWTTMHIVSLGYSPKPTEEEQYAATAFFNSLSNTIPCPICRTHYKMCLKSMPVENSVGSRDELIQWVFTIHNKVNEQLGKKEITFEQYIQNMQRLSEKDSIQIGSSSPSVAHIFAYVGIGALLGASGFYFYQKSK